MNIKTHHFLTLGVAVVAVALLVLWSSTEANKPTLNNDHLAGTWYYEGVNSQGDAWWMQYEFDASNYRVTAVNDFLEEGVYRVIKEAGDGSVVIEKMWETSQGERTYELAIVPGENESGVPTISFEGVTLTKVK